MKYDYGFRFDVGGTVGSGHFIRCVSLAEKLMGEKFKIIFLVNSEKEIKSYFKKENFVVHVLKSNNELENIKECKKIVKNISKLIIDLPFYNGIYSKSLKNYCEIIIIDDLGNKKIFSQKLFNGSIVNEFQKYSIDKEVTKVFSGTKYIILRSNFKNMRKEIIIKKKIKKILLTFGGSDEQNIIQKILPYFYNKKFKVTIILGPSYKFSNKLKKDIPKNANVKILQNEKNMAKRFSKQDLIISSSGMTSYELACIGTPTIFIPIDKYQRKTALEMEKNGFGLNYGFWDNDFLRLEECMARLSDYSIRKKMCFTGRKLVDGKGLTRILKIISH